MKKLLVFLGLLLTAGLAHGQCANLVAGIGVSITGMTVQFTNTSTSSNIASVVKMAAWDFGDGSSSISPNPSHTYTTAGTYNVSLVNSWVDTSNNNIICIDTAYAMNVTVPGGGPATNQITGKIYWDTTGNLAQAAFKVWLIVYDPVNQTLTAVDSVMAGGFMSANYSFLNHPAGSYRTKAAQTGNGTTQPATLLPTYHDTSLYWSNAQVINHTGGSTLGTNIWMQSGIPTSGPGFIGGSVTQGANKGTGGGIPGMLVFLRNASNDVVKMAYTDANGNYSFSNLATGTYNIYPEQINYATLPSGSLTLTAAQPGATGIDFERTNSNRTIRLKSLSAGSVSKNDFFNLYPNPSDGHITISWENQAAAVATITVNDMSGKTLMSVHTSTQKAYQLNAAHLPSGLYSIHIAADGAKRTEKIWINK